MVKYPSFHFFHNSKAEILDVLLHGGSKGVTSSFIQKIFTACQKKGHSVIASWLHIVERGEENSSGPELKEETKTLRNILKIAQYKNYKNIHLIGKSLGGIVISYFLKQLTKKKQKKYSIIFLGFVVGSVTLKGFTGKITIIQGEKDRFGNIKAVKRNLKNAKLRKVKCYEIKGADHSYRIPETKDPATSLLKRKLLGKL